MSDDQAKETQDRVRTVMNDLEDALNKLKDLLIDDDPEMHDELRKAQHGDE